MIQRVKSRVTFDNESATGSFKFGELQGWYEYNFSRVKLSVDLHSLLLPEDELPSAEEFFEIEQPNAEILLTKSEFTKLANHA